MRRDIITLDKLRKEQAGTIVGFIDATIGDKLMEMSFLPQSKVKMIRRAPLGDPIVVEINNHLLSMRMSEAKTVQIEI